MPISRARKEELVAQYVELLEQSNGIIVTQNTGMSVADFSKVRAKLRDLGSTYVVTKNTLLRLALEQVGMSVPQELLSGPVAVAFAHSDLGGTAKAVLDLDDEMELFVVSGAMIGETAYDAKGVETISKLPTLDEVRGSLVGLIIAPAQNLVSLLNAPPSELVSVINGGATQLLNVVAAYAAKGDAEAA